MAMNTETSDEMVQIRKSDLEKIRVEHEESLVVRRERLMAMVVHRGWRVDAEWVGRTVADARLLADAVMEAAK
jgi:hypothetical protein